MSIHFAVKTADDYIQSAAEPFRYPGGEWSLRNIADVHDPSAVWIADVRFSPDQGDVELTLAALFANIAHQRRSPFVLFLPYLPAARSDRGEPTGVRVYAERINAMNPQQVIGIDAHSPIVHRYMRNLTELEARPRINRALGYKDSRRTDWMAEAEKYDAVIAPDKGALNRATRAAGDLGRWGIDVYHAEKHRDFDTGRIIGVKAPENLPPSGRYLIVDDICDGGGTFMALAQETGLPKEQLGLWITHGIFSGRAIDLRQYYDRIYTTDSHPGHNTMTDGVAVATTIVPCTPYMLQKLKEFGNVEERAS